MSCGTTSALRHVWLVAMGPVLLACVSPPNRSPTNFAVDCDPSDRRRMVQAARASLTGRVIDDSTGTAVPGVRVVLSPGGREAVTDSVGVYRVDALCGNRYSIRVESDSWYQWSRPRIDVPHDSLRVRDVHVARLLCTDLTPFGQLSGVVVDDLTGEPIEGAQIEDEDGNCGAITDRRGRFTIRVVPAGEQRILVRRGGYEMLERDLAISAGEVTNVRLELRPVPRKVSFPSPPPDTGLKPSISRSYVVAHVLSGPWRAELWRMVRTDPRIIDTLGAIIRDGPKNVLALSNAVILMADVRDPRAEAAFLAAWDASRPGDSWRIGMLLALANKIEFFGPEGIRRLRMMLASPNKSERHTAVDVLGRARKPVLDGLLAERSGIETDPHIQGAIARAIGEAEP